MEIIQCPECHERFLDLLQVVEKGGEIRQVGLMLEAVCQCGRAWSVAAYWSKKETLTLEAER